MDFYDYLQQNNKQYILRTEEYKIPQFRNLDKVRSELLDAINEHKKVFIYGDYDVDGLFSAKIIGEMFRMAGHFDYTYSRFRKRTHAFDPVAAHKCIQGGYDLIVICDTGSSDVDRDAINRLLDCGVTVIVLDHHESNFTYEDYEDINIINVEMENKSEGTNYCLSAGGLCFCVASAVLDALNVNYNRLATYATVAMYADCMDMGDPLNQQIYHLSSNVQDKPYELTVFMNQYTSFNARYFQYWLAPRINAMFRAENLEIINRMYLQDNNDLTLKAIADELEDVYVPARELTNRIADIVPVTEMKHFVIADLSTVNPYINVFANKVYNYTGLIANKLAARYKKTAVCYCMSQIGYKGSLRDFYGRDFLSVFKSFCNANGHSAAFGFLSQGHEIPGIIQNITRLDNSLLNLSKSTPVIIEYSDMEPDTVLINDVAKYNEFAGKGMPYVFLKKQILGSMISGPRNKYGFNSRWGNLKISSDTELKLGEYVLLKPYFGKDTKLEVMS